jgi:hypothetical protein
MMPSAIYELLAADATLQGLLGGSNRIFELQSVDERPISNGYFVIIDMQETAMPLNPHMGPRTMQIWVHIPADISRDYGPISTILNRIDDILLAMENVVGLDGVRCGQIYRHSRSRNTIDPGWKTATRNALYSVSYDEDAA